MREAFRPLPAGNCSGLSFSQVLLHKLEASATFSGPFCGARLLASDYWFQHKDCVDCFR